MTPSICKIEEKKQLDVYLHIIRNSFKTVAADFGLNELNSPTNPAFITIEKLEELSLKAECFGVIENGIPCGFFAIEHNHELQVSYLERLCILPDRRHLGYGTTILDFTINYASEKGGNKISIGIMDKNTVLKEWYIKYGFNIVDLKKFSHIPFNVCFLDYHLK